MIQRKKKFTIHFKKEKHNGFSLIELLVVVAIIGILAAVGVVAYNGYTKHAKIAAAKSNHATITKYIGSQAIMCSIGNNIKYTLVSGKKETLTCPADIKNFLTAMAESVYTMGFKNPFKPPHAGWCQINVTNCSPPGWISKCDSTGQGAYYNGDKAGQMGIEQLNDTTLRTCTNLGDYGNGVEYIQNDIPFE